MTVACCRLIEAVSRIEFENGSIYGESSSNLSQKGISSFLIAEIEIALIIHRMTLRMRKSDCDYGTAKKFDVRGCF